MSVEESIIKENGPCDEGKTDDLFLKPDFIKPFKRKPAPINDSSVTINKNNAHCTIEEQSIPLNEEEIHLNKKPEKSPSQKLAEEEIPVPYKEPPWSGLPISQYDFEVIKNGVVIDKIPFNKSFMVVGRLSNCDIILEHPSISRFHCIIQYRKEESEHEGVYVYDLDSTHGTFQNKYRLQPKVFNRLRVGHMLKFGGSSRLFILQGPDEDEEPESELTVTELKAQASERKLKLQALESGEIDGDTRKSVASKVSTESDPTSDGIDWGMGEDAVEDDEDEREDESEGFNNPFSTNEELFLSDPKKTLRGWYEREGYDLPDYQVQELKLGTFNAKLELPISGTGDKPVICIVEHKGKKKDAVVQCALEACRILDRQGVLRQATHESHEKKRKEWSENDYYDSDDDDFLDRTGDIERKRKLRKKEHEAAKGIVEEVETYNSLKKQYSEVITRLEKLEADLKRVEDLKREQDALTADSSAFADADELEAYVAHLSSQLPDKHKRIAWKLETVQLGKEELRLRKLVNVARPLGVAELPERKSLYSDCKNMNTRKSSELKTFKKKIVTIGKIHKAFVEEEEEVKPKLRKINCRDDDNEDVGDVVPVPYSRPQRTVSKYDEVMNKERGKVSLTKAVALEPSAKSSSMKGNVSFLESDRNPSSKNFDKNSADLHISIQSDALMWAKEINDSEKRVDEKILSEASPPSTRKQIIGPSLPSSDNSLEFSKPCFKPPKQKILKEEKKKNLFDFEEKYETWIPPKGQTGDGRTVLNDKLGY